MGSDVVPVSKEGDSPGRIRRGWRHLGWLLAASAVVLASCSAHSSPVASNRLIVQIVLNTSQVVAGDPIKGHLVVHNPHAAINLTQVVKNHCEPGVVVILTQGSFHNNVGFTAQCSPTPFVISHGVTRLPITVLTTYASCTQSGGSSRDTPRCSSSGPPPLPRGSYKAVIEWSMSVPLPRPAPVDVSLT